MGPVLLQEETGVSGENLRCFGTVKLDTTLLKRDQGNYNQITAWNRNRTFVTVVRDTCTLPYRIVPYLTLSYLTLPHLISLLFTVLYLTLPYFISLHFTLPYLTLPNFTVLYLTLPYFTSLYTSHVKHVARGPHAALHKVKCGINTE